MIQAQDVDTTARRQSIHPSHNAQSRMSTLKRQKCYVNGGDWRLAAKALPAFCMPRAAALLADVLGTGPSKMSHF